MAGRAAASIQRFFRLRVSLWEPPETNRILGDPRGFLRPSGPLRVLRKPLAKGETHETIGRRYPPTAAPQWQASPGCDRKITGIPDRDSSGWSSGSATVIHWKPTAPAPVQLA